MGKKELCLSQKSVLKILSGQVTKLFIIEIFCCRGAYHLTTVTLIYIDLQFVNIISLKKNNVSQDSQSLS
jgi:hypothetical protein